METAAPWVVVSRKPATAVTFSPALLLHYLTPPGHKDQTAWPISPYFGGLLTHLFIIHSLAEINLCPRDSDGGNRGDRKEVAFMQKGKATISVNREWY